MREKLDHQADLVASIKEAALTREEAAALLRVSEHTLASWLKSPGSKSHNPVPLWAVDLLRLRCGLPQSPVSEAADAEGGVVRQWPDLRWPFSGAA